MAPLRVWRTQAARIEHDEQFLSALTVEGSEFESRKGKDFSPVHVVQTDSGTHPASYLMRTEGSFPRGVKRPWLEADHSPPPSVEVKKPWVLYINSPIRLYGVVLK
jgi:hypothetical protein